MECATKKKETQCAWVKMHVPSHEADALRRSAYEHDIDPTGEHDAYICMDISASASGLAPTETPTDLLVYVADHDRMPISMRFIPTQEGVRAKAGIEPGVLRLNAGAMTRGRTQRIGLHMSVPSVSMENPNDQATVVFSRQVDTLSHGYNTRIEGGVAMVSLGQLMSAMAVSPRDPLASKVGPDADLVEIARQIGPTAGPRWLHMIRKLSIGKRTQGASAAAAAVPHSIRLPMVMNIGDSWVERGILTITPVAGRIREDLAASIGREAYRLRVNDPGRGMLDPLAYKQLLVVGKPMARGKEGSQARIGNKDEEEEKGGQAALPLVVSSGRLARRPRRAFDTHSGSAFVGRGAYLHTDEDIEDYEVKLNNYLLASHVIDTGVPNVKPFYKRIQLPVSPTSFAQVPGPKTRKEFDLPSVAMTMGKTPRVDPEWVLHRLRAEAAIRQFPDDFDPANPAHWNTLPLAKKAELAVGAIAGTVARGQYKTDSLDMKMANGKWGPQPIENFSEYIGNKFTGDCEDVERAINEIHRGIVNMPLEEDHDQGGPLPVEGHAGGSLVYGSALETRSVAGQVKGILSRYIPLATLCSVNGQAVQDASGNKVPSEGAHATMTFMPIEHFKTLVQRGTQVKPVSGSLAEKAMGGKDATPMALEAAAVLSLPPGENDAEIASQVIHASIASHRDHGKADEEDEFPATATPIGDHVTLVGGNAMSSKYDIVVGNSYGGQAAIVNNLTTEALRQRPEALQKIEAWARSQPTGRQRSTLGRGIRLGPDIPPLHAEDVTGIAAAILPFDREATAAPIGHAAALVNNRFWEKRGVSFDQDDALDQLPILVAEGTGMFLAGNNPSDEHADKLKQALIQAAPALESVKYTMTHDWKPTKAHPEGNPSAFFNTALQYETDYFIKRGGTAGTFIPVTMQADGTARRGIPFVDLLSDRKRGPAPTAAVMSRPGFSAQQLARVAQAVALQPPVPDMAIPDEELAALESGDVDIPEPLEKLVSLINESPAAKGWEPDPEHEVNAEFYLLEAAMQGAQGPDGKPGKPVLSLNAKTTVRQLNEKLPGMVVGADLHVEYISQYIGRAWSVVFKARRDKVEQLTKE